jgi:hypothetical protein
VAGGGDYVLTVKDNQEHLRADIEACFIKAYDQDCQGMRSRAEGDKRTGIAGKTAPSLLSGA